MTGCLLMALFLRSENPVWKKAKIKIMILVLVIDIGVIIWGSVIEFGELYLVFSSRVVATFC